MTSFPIRSARPEMAVPPGRIGYDLDAEVLLLHTIQSAKAFDALLTTGTLMPEPTLMDSSWPDAYDWMLRMMKARLPTSGEAALWLWAQIRRVDLVGNCRRAPGEVLLTCRVPRERVLLSHFDEWHSVLNSNMAIPKMPRESDDEFDGRWDLVYDEFADRLKAAGMGNAAICQWPAPLRREAEQSWECIFDPRIFGTRDYWQATVHELHAGDVLEAVRIVS